MPPEPYPPLSGSESDDPYKYAPPHSLPVFFPLAALKRAPHEIKKLQVFIQYLFDTRSEVANALAGIEEPGESLHWKRVMARADIMCELRSLKTGLDKLFPS